MLQRGGGDARLPWERVLVASGPAPAMARLCSGEVESSGVSKVSRNERITPAVHRNVTSDVS